MFPILVLAVGLSAPNTESPAAQQGVGRVVLVTVVDAQNRSIVDLDVDDFVVDEQGQSRELFSVYVADYPIVLLLDNGPDTPGGLEAIRRAAARFIARIGQRPVALGTLAKPPAMVTSFEDDRATVLSQLDKIGVAASPDRMAVQAIATAAAMIRDSGLPFSAIVVISANPADADQTPLDARGEMLTSITDSGAIVHVIAHRLMVRTPPSAPGDSDVLRDVAGLNRGRYTRIFTTASYQPALDRLADELAAEMMIEYLVPAGSAPDAGVRVGVKVPGARVRGLGVSK